MRLWLKSFPLIVDRNNRMTIKGATISGALADFQSQMALSSLLTTFQHILNDFVYLSRPVPPSLDPKQILSNNFAPVGELPPTKCLAIEGTFPTSLNGAYIRNGPNPQYPPQGAYHLFDGDGMLHCIHISSNQYSTLCSRYVKTTKYEVERNAGYPVFPHVFSSFINGLPSAIAFVGVYMMRFLSGHYNAAKGIGLANTNLAYFGGKLFALGEVDLPYRIQLTENGDILTVGRYNFNGRFSPLSNMTAHPKVDPQTGETFAFRYSPMFPFLTYFRFDRNGLKKQDVPINSMTSPTFMHDFAITQKYAVFADTQISMSMNVIELIASSQSILKVEQSKVPRIGVIPRYSSTDSEMKWFNVPGCNILHTINAWDEEDCIVLIAVNILSVEPILERLDLIHSSVEKLSINLKSGTVTRSTMSDRNLDLGVINPNFIGRKNRYGYLGVGSPFPRTSGVVKLDWSSDQEKEVGCRMFGDNCYGGEPFFVPRESEQTDDENERAEDDGYLITYLHDENLGESKFLVMDAKSPTLDVVAAVDLPQRVPYGFHGLFMRERDLEKIQMEV